MRIVALGASGHAGRAIVELLAPRLRAGDELVLAGRDAARLGSARDALLGATPAVVSTATVDVEDLPAVRELVAGARLVIVTVSRPDLVGRLARIVLDAGADWVDTMLSTPGKHAELKALASEIEFRGRRFVTDGGFHPGLPAVLVRWAAGRLDEIVDADVYAGLRTDWHADTVADSTVAEMLDEFADFDMVAFVDGTRRRLRWSECPSVDFGPPIGRQTCVPTALTELDALPARYPSLRRCGFYISGFGPAMDYLALPVIMALSKVRLLRRPTIRLTRWSMGRLATSPPPHRLVLRLTASGIVDGRPTTAEISVSGEDGYRLTAAPVVACLSQLREAASGGAAPGLYLLAHVVDPEPFLDDLVALGLEVFREVSTGSSAR